MLSKHLKRFLTFALAGAMLLAAAGCGQKDEQNSNSGSGASQAQEQETAAKENSQESQQESSSQQQEEPSKLTALVIDEYVEDFETNLYTLMLEEKANVDLDFMLFTASDFTTQLSALVNGGGDLPDVIMCNRINGLLDEYGAEGIFLPITEYLQDPEKMPIYNNRVSEEDKELFIKSLQSPDDGEVYGAPSYYPHPNNNYYYSRGYINQDWLKAIGRDMPTTTDELYEVLKDFKEKDPNGNGIADEIPLLAYDGGWGTRFLMNAFCYVNHVEGAYNISVDDDGNVYPAFTTEEYKKGLEYINKLVSEDLFSPLTFTQDSSTFFATIRDPEIARVGLICTGGYDITREAAGYESYWPLPPLTGPDGAHYATYIEQFPEGRMAIFKDCKDVDAAVRLMDALYDEEVNILGRWGVEGVNYTTEIPEGYHIEGGGPGFYSIPENNIWAKDQNTHWMGYTVLYLPNDFQFSQSHAAVSDDLVYKETICANQERESAELPKNLYIYRPRFTSDLQEEFNDLSSAITTYVSESTTRFETGQMPFSEWDNYVKELDNMDLDRLIEMLQQFYDQKSN